MRYNTDQSIALCIDVENKKAILEYIRRSNKHKKKFNYIADVILKRLKITDVYDKEEINKKSKNVTAMKFFKGGSNDRIYCKEQRLNDRTYIIVAVELFEKKKTQGLSAKAKNIIEKIGGYDYEIVEE